jgi:hypothetical protein
MPGRARRQRSVYALIVAKHAGESLTATELHRLRRYDHHSARILSVLTEGFATPSRIRRGVMFDGATYGAMRRELLSGLRRQSPSDLRILIRRLLALHGIGFARIAELVGRNRRLLRQRRHGGQRSGRARRSTAAALVRDIGAVQARHPATLTLRAACDRYLRDTLKADYFTLAETDRNRRVAALARRYRRAQQKDRTRS